MMKNIKTIIVMAIVLITGVSIYACGPLPVRAPNNENVKIITGAFGYKFGDTLERSIGPPVIKYLFTETYRVKPIVKNKEFDHYLVEVCKRTRKIYLIAAFRTYDTEAEARNKFNDARPIIQKKYGALDILADDRNYYSEYVQHGPFQIRLIIMRAKSGTPESSFMIAYVSDEHERSCKGW